MGFFKVLEENSNIIDSLENYKENLEYEKYNEKDLYYKVYNPQQPQKK